MQESKAAPFSGSPSDPPPQPPLPSRQPVGPFELHRRMRSQLSRSTHLTSDHFCRNRSFRATPRTQTTTEFNLPNLPFFKGPSFQKMVPLSLIKYSFTCSLPRDCPPASPVWLPSCQHHTALITVALHGYVLQL